MSLAGSAPPPLPINAIWVDEGSARCTFDRPLTPGALNAANWLASYGGTDWVFTTAAASGSQVNLSGAMPSGLQPETRIKYDPPPFDVRSLPGTPAAAFDHLYIEPPPP